MTPCLTLLLAIVSAGCGPAAGTPEEQIREWVAVMESAAEARERGTIIDLVAPAYNDARGQGRADVDKLLRLYFLRQDRIALLSSIDEIRVDGGTAALVTLTVGMAGTGDRALDLRADAYRFELELAADDLPESYADWRLLSARWGELGEPLR